MGYETKVYIGRVSDIKWRGDGNMKWMAESISFDLHKIGDSKLGELFRKYKEQYDKDKRSVTRVYVYAPASERKIKDDCYDDVMIAVPFFEAFEAVAFDAKDKEFDSDYIKILYDIMKSMKRHYGKRGVSGMSIARYGH